MAKQRYAFWSLGGFPFIRGGFIGKRAPRGDYPGPEHYEWLTESGQCLGYVKPELITSLRVGRALQKKLDWNAEHYGIAHSALLDGFASKSQRDIASATR